MDCIFMKVKDCTGSVSWRLSTALVSMFRLNNGISNNDVYCFCDHHFATATGCTDDLDYWLHLLLLCGIFSYPINMMPKTPHFIGIIAYSRNVCAREVKGLHSPYQALWSACMSNGTVNFTEDHHWSTRPTSRLNRQSVYLLTSSFFWLHLSFFVLSQDSTAW